MKRLLPTRLPKGTGSIVVLLLLCAWYSYATMAVHHPVNPRAARTLADAMVQAHGDEIRALIIVRDTEDDRSFAEALGERLREAGVTDFQSVIGQPPDARRAIDEALQTGQLDAIGTHHALATQWTPMWPERLENAATAAGQTSSVQVHVPRGYRWPSFLTRANLLNVLNQNARIAIIAIGMTLVIITAGIDLSVGSVMALAAVVTAVTIRDWAGGAAASQVAVLLCCALGVSTAAAAGAFSGVMVTAFRVPAFVVTLALMMVCRGLAFIIAQQPEAVEVEARGFSALANGDVFGIPTPVVIMFGLYAAAHVVMTRTAFGRYVYAVGGNAEAARLAGVPVMIVLIMTYALCGALTGLSGVIDASKFGGRPNAGNLYELHAIAAVVVGGTSLAGGEGTILRTLVGALIIAVIRNGLNMAGVPTFERMVVIGLLVLGAVLVDNWKRPRQSG